MSSFSPLSTILNQNKLTGPNYVDWKRNLDIVLMVEGHKFVLSEPCPNEPGAESSKDDQQRYICWKKYNEMTKCYILASLSNVIEHQLQDINHGAPMMMLHDDNSKRDVWRAKSCC